MDTKRGVALPLSSNQFRDTRTFIATVANCFQKQWLVETTGFRTNIVRDASFVLRQIEEKHQHNLSSKTPSFGTKTTQNVFLNYRFLKKVGHEMCQCEMPALFMASTQTLPSNDPAGLCKCSGEIMKTCIFSGD